MKVSVVICTFNRCQSLARTLESLTQLTMPQSTAWEVLVVDNNSGDTTRQVAESFCQRFPELIRYVSERRPGKSVALNRGIAEASGEILAFTDDDVVFSSDWLHNLTRNLAGDEWVGAAGRTLPDGTLQVPPWLPCNRRDALAPLAIFDPPIEAGPLNAAPYGVNMAFRRKVFEIYGGFRTDLGPNPNSEAPQKSEDSEFGHRLLAGGERIRYEPSAILYHSVPQSRLRKSYFLAWWFDKARADARAFGCPLRTRWIVAGVPLRLFGRLGRWTISWLLATDPSSRFDRKLNMWANCGEILECFLQARALRSRG